MIIRFVISCALYLIQILVFSLENRSQYLLPIFTLFMIGQLSTYKFRIEAMTIPSLILLGTGCVGYLGSKTKNSALGTSLNVILPAELQLKTLSLFCISASSLLLGNQIANLSSLKRTNTIKAEKVEIPRYIGILCIVPLLLMIVGFETQEFLYREKHLLNTNFSLLARLGSAMSLIAVPVLAVWTSAERGSFKLIGVIQICLYAILFFSTSSRALVVIPVAVLIVLWPKLHKFARLVALFCLPFTSYLGIGIPLYLRSLDEEGLLPYSKAVQSFNLEKISNQEVFQNFLVSFDLNGLGAFSISRFELRDLFIELSPLLGKQAGWYEISSIHRFNFATPVPALGESMNYGLQWLILIFISCGIIIGVLHRLAKDNASKLSKIAEYFVISGASYFAILCLQYNLRSAIRIVYYLIAGVFVFYIFSLNQKSNRRRSYKLSSTSV